MNPIDGTLLPAASNDDGLTGAYTPLDPDKVAAAERVVREFAADADVLLGMLGIEVATDVA